MNRYTYTRMMKDVFHGKSDGRMYERKKELKNKRPRGGVCEGLGDFGDAHAGKWHRQVSLLSYEKIEAFKALGAEIDFGAGENLVVSGYDFKQCLWALCLNVMGLSLE